MQTVFNSRQLGHNISFSETANTAVYTAWLVTALVVLSGLPFIKKVVAQFLWFAYTLLIQGP